MTRQEKSLETCRRKLRFERLSKAHKAADKALNYGLNLRVYRCPHSGWRGHWHLTSSL